MVNMWTLITGLLPLQRDVRVNLKKHNSAEPAEQVHYSPVPEKVQKAGEVSKTPGIHVL